MNISDLLAMLTGGGGDAAATGPNANAAPPAGGAPQQGGGIAPFLGDTDPGAPDQATPPQPYQVSAPPTPAAPAPPPAPSTPPSDEQDHGGLSGFLSRMVQKATNRDQDTGMSFIDKLGKFGGQITDMAGDTRGAAANYDAQAKQRVADTQAEAKRQQLQQMADALGMSPREKLIFTANPDAWVAANAKGLEPATLPGGDTRLVTGAAPYTAPKVGQEGGEGYSLTPDGMKDLGGLAPSPQQEVQNNVKQAQQAALSAYHQTMAKAAQVRAAADQQRANRPALGNGGDWRSRVVGHGVVQ